MYCKECGQPMRLDDRDKTTKYHYDNYWECDTCNVSCIEQVRCGISLNEHWYTEKDGIEEITTIRKL